MCFDYRTADECHELDTSEVRTTVKYECINNMCITNGKLESFDSNKHGDNRTLSLSLLYFIFQKECENASTDCGPDEKCDDGVCMKIPTEPPTEVTTSKPPTESPIPELSTKSPTVEPSTESPGRKYLSNLISFCHNKLIWYFLKRKNSIGNQP